MQGAGGTLPAFVRDTAGPLAEADLLAIGVVLVGVMAVMLFRRVRGDGR